MQCGEAIARRRKDDRRGASRPEDLVSDGGVSPHVFDHRVVPALGVVLHWYNPLGSAVDAGRDATARARWAECVANGGVVSVQHALHVSPRALPINAQRVAQFDHYRTRNYLPPKKLRRNIP
jgi:hypothetical protein